ncbi:MAG TPA: hypothetical protein VGE40_04570 [Bacilli bacterium]
MSIFSLPQKFDFNEWFILAAMIVVCIYIPLLQKRFPIPIIIIIMMALFSLALEKAADLIFEYPPYNFYYLNDKIEYELFDLFVCFLYPASGYIFIYFYSKWNIRGLFVFLYALSWSVIAIGCEWISILARIFIYRDWNLLYSYPIYLISLYLYIVFYHFVLLHFSQEKKSQF